MDAYEAFAALRRKGQTVDEISKRFGLTARGSNILKPAGQKFGEREYEAIKDEATCVLSMEVDYFEMIYDADNHKRRLLVLHEGSRVERSTVRASGELRGASAGAPR